MSYERDELLLAKVKEGDKAAFKTLAEIYLNKIWRLAYNILRNKPDAEDVTQEVLITVWNNREKWLPGAATFSTWLYRVTFNKAIDLKRRRRDTSELDDALEDNEKLADDKAADKQMQRVFMDCLAGLPEKQRLSLMFYYYEGLSIEQICERLQATEDSIRSLLKRGKVSLKEALNDRLGDEYWRMEGFGS